MCGIAGYISDNGFDQESFQSALNSMLHRGPDGYGVWCTDDRRVFLGHRRLAVIDISEKAAQPMKSSDGNIIITFNGEIYNYKLIKAQLQETGYQFNTESDTEVVLIAWKHWGVDCLERLQGMFAFVIYDIQNRKIFAIRDRAGEKPFYYSIQNRTFCFASELKSLMKLNSHSAIVNHEAMNYLLGMGYVPRDLSILNGYKKLLPAHYLEYDCESGEHCTKQYWKLPAFIYSGTSTSQLIDELDSLLTSSVERQLQADVETGVLLSGGLDSSLITAYAKHINPQIKTFTATFPGHQQADESEYAKLIANHFQTNHTELKVEAPTPEILFELSKQYDEPIADTSILPTYLLSKKIREHCTVAIGGDGADELFGGYDRYQQWFNMEQKFGSVPLIFRKTISSIASHFIPQGIRGKHYLQELGTDFNNNIPTIDSLFSLQERKKLAGHNLGLFSTLPLRKNIEFLGIDVMEKAMRSDFHLYMPDNILVKVDRASMLSSLEVRAPFLDVRIIEFAFSKVPSSMKVSSSEKKILLKMLAKDKLPKSFDYKRKQGFLPPMEQWLKEKKWRIFMEDHLLSDRNSWWNRFYIEKLIKGQEKGRFNKRRLFLLLMIELWRKEYKVQL